MGVKRLGVKSPGRKRLGSETSRHPLFRLIVATKHGAQQLHSTKLMNLKLLEIILVNVI